MADFNIIIEKGEDNYLISEVIELPGCHTQAKTMPELLERIKEAIELCLEVKKMNKEKFAPPEFIGIQQLEVVV